MDAPQVTIIVVNYNTSADTVACVQSVERTTAADFEVVVVDNGSADDSVAALTEHTAGVVIEAGENLGFARGVNRGVAVARSEWILLLNPDAIVEEGAVDALLSFAKRYPEFGMYGGRTLTPQGGTDPSSCWGEMTLWSLVCFATGLSTVFKRSRVFDPESLGRWDRDTVREVPVITGCLMLMSRRNWDRLGGLDERYFLYGEDAEFSRRARRAGLRPIIVPDARMIHMVGGSTSSSGSKMCMVMAGKTTVLRHTRARIPAAIGIGLLQAGALTRGLLEIAAGRGKAATWGTVWSRRREWRPGYPEAQRHLFGGRVSVSGPRGAAPRPVPASDR